MVDIEIIRDKNDRAVRETISINPQFVETVEQESIAPPLSILFIAGRKYMCPTLRKTLVKILDPKRDS